MASQVIFLKEALKIISLKDRDNKPFPFDLRYRNFNSQTKRGGKIIEYKGVKHLPSANPNSELSLHPEVVFAREKPSRNPNHFDNRTRNIELSSGEIKTIRIDFIIQINGNTMIY
jgi:hypothetical protein